MYSSCIESAEPIGELPQLLAGLPAGSGERLRTAAIGLAGAGNIGSHLAPILAKLGVGRLRIVDRDAVELKNVLGQDFSPEDVGRPKAQVLADKLRRLCPGVEIEAYAADIADMPRASMQCNLWLGALDSRLARQLLVSEIAWPMGIPTIDGGLGEGLEGRVQVLLAGPTTACLECTWGQNDYRLLAMEYSCIAGMAPMAPPTGAPALLGSVVAGIMAAEAVRILAGVSAQDSREVAFNLLHQRFIPSKLRRSPRCRFDHEIVQRTWRMQCRLEDTTAGELFAFITSRLKGQQFHLELGIGQRGQDGLPKRRYVPADELQQAPGRRLADLGIARHDWLRVRSGNSSSFVVLDQM